MARDDFLLWRDTVGDFLEEIPGWKGISTTLEKLQQSRIDATPARVAEMAGATIDAVTEKSKTLYGLLKSKFNTTMRALRKDIEKDRNGFEVYRRLSNKYSPVSESPHLVLFDQICDMRAITSKNFGET